MNDEDELMADSSTDSHKEPAHRLLIYGIGNPGREDDGLGFEFVKKISNPNRKIPVNWEIHHNYQLNIEDSDLFSNFDKILLVDAATKIDQPYEIQTLAPKAKAGFSSHSLTPEAVMAITREVYNKSPTTLLLAIQGSSFDIKLGLSSTAQIALKAAVDWFWSEFECPGTS